MFKTFQTMSHWICISHHVQTYCMDQLFLTNTRITIWANYIYSLQFWRKGVEGVCMDDNSQWWKGNGDGGQRHILTDLPSPCVASWPSGNRRNCGWGCDSFSRNLTKASDSDCKMQIHYYKLISVVNAWLEICYVFEAVSLSRCKRRQFQLCGTSYKKPFLTIRHCSRWWKNYTNERKYATPIGDRQQKINHTHNMSNYYHRKLK